MVALGPAVPVSRRSSMGVPMGVRGEPRARAARGRFDIVHGFEPGLPSLSYLALRDAQTLAVATFFSPERLAYPPAERSASGCSAAIDALLADVGARPRRPPPSASPATTGCLAGRRPRAVPPGAKRRLIVVEFRRRLALARAALRALRELPGWEARPAADEAAARAAVRSPRARASGPRAHRAATAMRARRS